MTRTDVNQCVLTEMLVCHLSYDGLPWILVAAKICSSGKSKIRPRMIPFKGK